MRVLRDCDKGTITLNSSSTEEETILREIIATLKPKERLPYSGRSGADPGDPYNEGMTISFVFDGRKFSIAATTDEDEGPIRYMRDAIYFGGNFVFLSGKEVDGKPSLEITINFCKHCDKPIATMGECEWKTCKACADKCDHHYIRGMVHGGDAGIMGMGEYCDKCGRGKPRPEGERKKSQVERELEVQRELGVVVMYKNLPGMGPKDVVKAERLHRRLTNSRAKSQNKPKS